MQETIYHIVFGIGSVLLVGQLVQLVRAIGRIKRSARGVTMVEYAILLALISIAVAAAFPTIGDAIKNVFSKASSVLTVK